MSDDLILIGGMLVQFIEVTLGLLGLLLIVIGVFGLKDNYNYGKIRHAILPSSIFIVIGVLCLYSIYVW